MKSKINAFTLSALLALGLSLPGMISSGFGDPCNHANPGISPPRSSAFGKNYGEWAVTWWRWALSSSTNENPLLDLTGADAAVGQSGPVWFLGGAVGSGNIAVTRNITVPEDKALFFPLINTLWTTGPLDPPITVPEIRSILTGVTADVSDLACEIDGVPVQHLENYAVQSPVFRISLTSDNVLGLGEGVYTPDVDEGFYLLLAPLRPGRHTIHFKGNNVDLGYALDITYHLTVVRRGER